MNYSKYLSDFYIEDLYLKYDEDFLNNMDEKKFDEIYNIFIKYKFNYIEDIISNYIEIFVLEPFIVEKKVNNLYKSLGEDFVEYISNEMNLLEYIIR